MRKGIVLVAVIAFSMTPVMAFQGPISVAPDAFQLSAGDAAIGVNGTEGANIIQDFETFNLGSGIQNGWTGFFGAGPPPVGFNIVNSGIPGFGARSARHISDGSNFAGFEMVSPIAAVAPGVLAGDVIISNGASLYQFIAVNTVAGFFNTRLNFEANGTITALQISGPPPCTSGVFAPTTGTWTPNVKMRIAIEVPGNGTLLVYKDGVQIFSGHDIAGFCSGNNTGINQYRTFAANATGTAQTSHYTIDNINDQIPEPSTLALLGLGALGLIRRRR